MAALSIHTVLVFALRGNHQQFQWNHLWQLQLMQAIHYRLLVIRYDLCVGKHFLLHKYFAKIVFSFGHANIPYQVFNR